MTPAAMPHVDRHGGWTVFNNKGQPVRQFEPFFTDTHAFEARPARRRESDPRLRPAWVASSRPLLPDHTWEKVIFDSWRQESWDVNDTVLVADPPTDPDVGDFFRRLPAAEYLPTWHAQRPAGALGR